MKLLHAGMLLLALQSSIAGATEPSQRHLLVIVGLGGEPHYTKLFNEWAAQMAKIAEHALHVTGERITVLQGSEDGSAGAPRKEDILAAIEATGEASASEDLVMLLFIGHGTARDGRVLFNLPGPDLSATELSERLQALRGRALVIVNTTSSSGAFVRELSAPERVVITATASGSEYQFAYFGGHFIAAFVADTADLDKDRRVSMLEAFKYAQGAVARAYKEDEKILTEHALLDDNGDGVGSRLTEASSEDGTLAARIYMQPSVGELAGDSVHAREMLALDVRASELVNRIDRLKRRREQLLDEEFYQELESLLVTLAYNRREFRDVEDSNAAPLSQ